MLHSSQCSCSAPVASFCQTEHSLDVSEEWYSDYDPRECILPGSISYSPLFYLKCLLLRVCCPLDCIYVHSVFMLTASPRLFAEPWKFHPYLEGTAATISQSRSVSCIPDPCDHGRGVSGATPSRSNARCLMFGAAGVIYTSPSREYCC